MNIDSGNNSQVLSRKDRERELHRNEILAAAERVFVRDGISTKIESIAREAEFAVGSIYNFFPSKDELFKGVLLRVSQLRLDDMTDAVRSASDAPWEGFDGVVRAWITHHVTHGDFLHVAMSQRAKGRGTILPEDDPFEKKIAVNRERYRSMLIDYFRLLAALPNVRTLDPELMYTAFEGYNRTSLMKFVFNNVKVDTDQMVRSVTENLRMLFGEKRSVES